MNPALPREQACVRAGRIEPSGAENDRLERAHQKRYTIVAWKARAACWFRICRKFGLKRSLAPL